jgi:hypothetical protein
LFEPSHVRGFIRVIPEHGRAHVVIRSGPMEVANDGEEISAGREPASEARNERALVGNRNIG